MQPIEETLGKKSEKKNYRALPAGIKAKHKRPSRNKNAHIIKDMENISPNQGEMICTEKMHIDSKKFTPDGVVTEEPIIHYSVISNEELKESTQESVHMEVFIQGEKKTEPAPIEALSPMIEYENQYELADENDYPPFLPYEPEGHIIDDFKMTSENRPVFDCYGMDMLEDLNELQLRNFPENILKKHNISPILRAKMVNWMIEIHDFFHLSKRTFFLSVAIMDNYYAKTQRILSESDVHLTGLTCMFMASKLEEVIPLRLKIVYDKIGRRQIAKELIVQKEQEIFQTLDYDTWFVTPLNLLDHYMITIVDYFMSRPGKKLSDEDWNILKLLKEGAAKFLIMCAYDHRMQKYIPSSLTAGAIYAKSIKINLLYSYRFQDILTEAIGFISSEEENNVMAMEACAQEIEILEANFFTRFPELLNVFYFDLQP